MVLFTMRVTLEANARGEVLSVLRSLASSTGLRRGCLGAHLLQDLEERNALTWVEEWESEAELSRHIRSDEYRKLLAVIDMSISQPEIRFHTVARTAGIEFIEANRRPEPG